jgi:hypothetical protein
MQNSKSAQVNDRSFPRSRIKTAYTLVFILTILTSAIDVASATSCADFNRLGTNEEYGQDPSGPVTEAQAAAFKDAIAQHASRLAFVRFTTRSRALKYAQDNNMLTKLLRESLAMTREWCWNTPAGNMEKIATDHFDYLLDAIGRGLEMSTESDLGGPEQLSAMASNINKSLPMMVDAVTECFVVTPLDHELDFSYRITTMEKGQVSINEEKVKKERVNYACSHPNIRPILEKNIKIRYSYFDKNRVFIWATQVTKADCPAP